MGNENSQNEPKETDDLETEGDETTFQTSLSNFARDKHIQKEAKEIILYKDHSKYVPYTPNINIPWINNNSLQNNYTSAKNEIYNDIYTTPNGNGIWIIYDFFQHTNPAKCIKPCLKVPKKYKLTFTKFHDCVFQVGLYEKRKR
eukprot:197790_1